MQPLFFISKTLLDVNTSINIPANDHLSRGERSALMLAGVQVITNGFLRNPVKRVVKKGKPFHFIRMAGLWDEMAGFCGWEGFTL